MKRRLDILLLERGLAPSRERAQAMILAGRVLVDEQKVEKPGHAVAEDCSVRLLGAEQRYVSRGGLKLEAALAYWNIAVEGAVCMDVGASTGGFTDCLLQHGAASVLAVDTGYGQIDARLRADSRVRLLEKRPRCCRRWCAPLLTKRGSLFTPTSQPRAPTPARQQLARRGPRARWGPRLAASLSCS